ncbi:MAG: hypothetical protein QXJ27_03915 [Thermoplasmata archaeon]
MSGTKEMVEKMRKILIDAAGPIADFVIKKQIRDMGYTLETFPGDKLLLLVDRVVENAIYDPEKKVEIRNKLRKELRKDLGGE